MSVANGDGASREKKKAPRGLREAPETRRSPSEGGVNLSASRAEHIEPDKAVGSSHGTLQKTVRYTGREQWDWAGKSQGGGQTGSAVKKAERTRC